MESEKDLPECTEKNLLDSAHVIGKDSYNFRCDRNTAGEYKWLVYMHVHAGGEAPDVGASSSSAAQSSSSVSEACAKIEGNCLDKLSELGECSEENLDYKVYVVEDGNTHTCSKKSSGEYAWFTTWNVHGSGTTPEVGKN